MTDNDIIKALGCCIDGRCSCCPLYYSSVCISEVQERVFDLINRQKKEIDRLKQNHVLKIGEAQEHYRNQIGRARGEAIKEFAERLKKRTRMPLGTLYGEMVYLKDIDNLVKEMTEDN